MAKIFIKSDGVSFYRSPHFEYKPKLAIFELHECILLMDKKTPSRWQFMFETCVDKLKALDATHSIIIISNCTNMKCTMVEMENALTDIIGHIPPFIGFFIFKKNNLNKPWSRLWRSVCSGFEKQNIVIDTKSSFFCGPAGGRIGARSDRDWTDRAFAHNIGVVYYSPEYLFKDLITEKDRAWRYPAYIYTLDNYIKFVKENNINHIAQQRVVENFMRGEHKQNLVILVGPPSSGKSTFAHEFAQNRKWRIVTEPKPRPKILTETRKLLCNGYNIIIDANNPTQDMRTEWADVAMGLDDVHITIISFITPLQLCQHLYCMSLENSPTPQLYAPPNYTGWIKKYQPVQFPDFTCIEWLPILTREIFNKTFI
jgi:DNA 3'-phosphatase